MSLIIPPGYASVLHSLSLPGDLEPMAVTYGVGSAAGLTQSEVDDLADSLHDAFCDNWVPRISGSYTITQTEVRYCVGPDPEDIILGVFVDPRVTTQENAALPQNSATLLHKRTGSAGKRGRGRMYIPGVPEGEVSATGGLAAPWRTILQTTASAWLVALADNAFGVEMVLLHGVSTAIPPSPVPAPTVVTALTVDPIIATQRRRLR